MSPLGVGNSGILNEQEEVGMINSASALALMLYISTVTTGLSVHASSLWGQFERVCPYRNHHHKHDKEPKIKKRR